jgi:hypothetical protein
LDQKKDSKEEWVTILDHNQLENAILLYCQEHYQQASVTPFGHGHLAALIGKSGLTDAGTRILQGTLFEVFDKDLFPEVATFLVEIATPEEIKALPPISHGPSNLAMTDDPYWYALPYHVMEQPAMYESIPVSSSALNRLVAWPLVPEEECGAKTEKQKPTVGCRMQTLQTTWPRQLCKWSTVDNDYCSNCSASCYVFLWIARGESGLLDDIHGSSCISNSKNNLLSSIFTVCLLKKY